MNSKRIIQIILLVIASVGFVYMIYGTFFKEGPRFGKATFSKSLKVSTDPLEVALDSIVINLGKGPYSYLKVEISLKAYDSLGKKDIDQNSALVRRLILQLSSQQDGNELATDQGKQAFKREIQEVLNDQLRLNVEAVYFRNFVLAR